jgi:hypothetical protein
MEEVVESSKLGQGYISGVQGSFRQPLRAESALDSFRRIQPINLSCVSMKKLEEERATFPRGLGHNGDEEVKSIRSDPEACNFEEANTDRSQIQSSRHGRWKSRRAVRGGARMGGRCQWAVRAVRDELRRRAWGVLAGQARLQVGRPLLLSGRNEIRRRNKRYGAYWK